MKYINKKEAKKYIKIEKYSKGRYIIKIFLGIITEKTDEFYGECFLFRRYGKIVPKDKIDFCIEKFIDRLNYYINANDKDFLHDELLLDENDSVKDIMFIKEFAYLYQ